MKLLKKLSTNTKLKVRFSETDAMGVVFHTNYINWFHIGLEKLLTNLEVDINRLLKDQILFPLIESHCRFVFPARYGDLVKVVATPYSTNIAKFTVRFQVFHETNRRLLAEGENKYIISKKGKTLVRLPKELLFLSNY